MGLPRVTVAVADRAAVVGIDAVGSPDAVSARTTAAVLDTPDVDQDSDGACAPEEIRYAAYTPEFDPAPVPETDDWARVNDPSTVGEVGPPVAPQ